MSSPDVINPSKSLSCAARRADTAAAIIASVNAAHSFSCAHSASSLPAPPDAMSEPAAMIAIAASSISRQRSSFIGCSAPHNTSVDGAIIATITSRTVAMCST